MNCYFFIYFKIYGILIIGDSMKEFKKRIKEKIKLYSNDEYLDGYIKNEFLSEDGSANIMLKLRDKDDLFDLRTVGNQLDVNERVYDYIEEKSSMLNNDILLNFHIIDSKLNKEEKEKVTDIIKEHYAIELYKIQKKYKRSRIKILRLLIMGILFFFIYSFIAYNTEFLLHYGKLLNI